MDIYCVLRLDDDKISQKSVSGGNDVAESGSDVTGSVDGVKSAEEYNYDDFTAEQKLCPFLSYASVGNIISFALERSPPTPTDTKRRKNTTADWRKECRRARFIPTSVERNSCESGGSIILYVSAKNQTWKAKLRQTLQLHESEEKSTLCASENRIYRTNGILQQRPTASSRKNHMMVCLLYTSPSPRDGLLSRMPSSA